MTKQGSIVTTTFTRYKLLFTGIVSVLIVGLLCWQYFHGGVPAHHILQKKELPEISNWWGALLLPVLTWVLLSRIEKRMPEEVYGTANYKSAMLPVLMRLMIGLALGLLLAISFTYDYKPFPDNVLYILLILAFIIPIYYAEFILGFVLGMTFTFGVILPTAFILILAAIGLVIFKFIRPLFVKLFGYMKR